MHKVKVTINLAPYNITQFDSVEEALRIVPHDVILRWINYAWRTYTIMTYVNCQREAERAKGV